MGWLDKLNPFKKKAPAPPVTIPVATPIEEVATPEVTLMTTEEIQAEIGRLVVLIPQCSTEHLRKKYQRKLDLLIQAAQG